MKLHKQLCTHLKQEGENGGRNKTEKITRLEPLKWKLPYDLSVTCLLCNVHSVSVNNTPQGLHFHSFWLMHLRAVEVQIWEESPSWQELHWPAQHITSSASTDKVGSSSRAENNYKTQICSPGRSQQHLKLEKQPQVSADKAYSNFPPKTGPPKVKLCYVTPFAV